MKPIAFGCQAGAMREALGAIVALTRGRIESPPILRHALIELDGDVAQLTASAIDVEARIGLPVAIERRGAPIAVHAELLEDALRTLPREATVHFASTGSIAQHAILTCDETSFRLPALPAADFPRMSLDTPSATLRVRCGALRRALIDVHHAMADRDPRAYLCGAMIEHDGERAQLAASDGHRLALTSMEAEGCGEIYAILPRRLVHEAIRALDERDDEIALLEMSAEKARLALSGMHIACALVAGTYPDLSRVIDSARDNKQSLTTDSAALRAALDRVSVCAEGREAGIRLALADGALALAARERALDAEASTSVRVQHDGGQASVDINARYLREALEPIEGDAVMRLDDQAPSVLIEPAAGDCYTAVVATMRL